MKLAWLTDIHLNFLEKEGRVLFYQKILNSHCDGVLISGDISEAPAVRSTLLEMAGEIKRPIYFVLGNHDYYRGEIRIVREEMTELTQEQEFLFWLPAQKVQRLNNEVILVGQDGWADGRYGDFDNTRVLMNDHRLIVDFFQAQIYGKVKLLEKMQALAENDARQMESNLLEAVDHHPKTIIILTHVPPFKEVCFYRGKITDDDFLPFYSSKVMGEMLLRIAEENSGVEFLVLCGHTHGRAEYQPLKNLKVKVGKAEYSAPEIQEVIVI